MKFFGFDKDKAGIDYEILYNSHIVAKEKNLGLIIYGDVGCGKSFAIRAMYPKMQRIDCSLPNAFDSLTTSDFGDLIIDDLGVEEQKQDFGIRREMFSDHISQRSFKMMERKITDLIPVVKNIHYEETEEQLQERKSKYMAKLNVGRLYITTNLSLEQIGEKYGIRTLTRLSEMCVPCEFKGKNKRTWTTVPKG